MNKFNIGDRVRFINPAFKNTNIGDPERPMTYGTEGIVLSVVWQPSDRPWHYEIAFNARHHAKAVFLHHSMPADLIEAAPYVVGEKVIVTQCGMHKGRWGKIERVLSPSAIDVAGISEPPDYLRPLWFVELYENKLPEADRHLLQQAYQDATKHDEQIAVPVPATIEAVAAEEKRDAQLVPPGEGTLPPASDADREAFYRAAAKALKEIGAKKKSFTTDDIWAKIPAAVAGLVEPRAMGAFMQAAARQFQVAATRRTRPSKRPESHRRPVRVWSSLFYGQASS